MLLAAYEHKCYQLILDTIFGYTTDEVIPVKMPVISIAAANMPAVWAYWGSTVCGAYIIPNELKSENGFGKVEVEMEFEPYPSLYLPQISGRESQ